MISMYLFLQPILYDMLGVCSGRRARGVNMTEPRAGPGELLQGLTSILVEAEDFLRQKFHDYDDSPLRRCYQLAAGELISVANEPGTMSQDQWSVISARSYLIRESSTISEGELRLATELRQLADFIGLIPLRPSVPDRRELLRQSILALAGAVNGPLGDATAARSVEEPAGDGRAAKLRPAILVASGTSPRSRGAAQELVAGLSDPSFDVIDLTACRDISGVSQEVERAKYSKAYSVLVLDEVDTNDANRHDTTQYNWFILFGILLCAATPAGTYLAIEGEAEDTRFEPVVSRLQWSRKQQNGSETFGVTGVVSTLKTAVRGTGSSN
jgi:hypothetical protein